ncbi:hypothetical protein HDV05_005527 [Chytridiales sp. JEL 0842]|nr:hypothetical protein HDV05_005527 [Chytridiales sp. JEL 0842]
MSSSPAMMRSFHIASLLHILSATINIPTAQAYTPLGCYMDSGKLQPTEPSFLLRDFWIRDPNNTVARCAQRALDQGLKYFGVQAMDNCYAGSTPFLNSEADADGICGIRCGGNQNQQCGHYWKLSVYSTAPEEFSFIPGVQTTNPPSYGRYAYVGCIDDYAERLFRGQGGDRFIDSTMTIEKCQALAERNGAKHFGLEVGSECYFGNDVFWRSTRKVRDGECGARCPGNQAEFCGSPWRMQMYVHDELPDATTTTIAPLSTAISSNATSTATVRSSTTSLVAAATSETVPPIPAPGQAAPSSSAQQNSNVSTGVIAGASIGSVLLVGLLIGGFLYHRRQRSTSKKPLQPPYPSFDIVTPTNNNNHPFPPAPAVPIQSITSVPPPSATPTFSSQTPQPPTSPSDNLTFVHGGSYPLLSSQPAHISIMQPHSEKGGMAAATTATVTEVQVFGTSSEKSGKGVSGVAYEEKLLDEAPPPSYTDLA